MWVFTVASLTNSSTGDLAVRQPARDQRQHLCLAGGEVVRQRCRRLRSAACAALGRAAAERSRLRAAAAGRPDRAASGAPPRPAPRGRSRRCRRPWSGSRARPALSASRIDASSAWVVSTTTSVSGWSARIRRGRLHPVHVRHPQVHQHDVGPVLGGQLDRLPPVGSRRRPARSRGDASAASSAPRARAPGRRRPAPGSPVTCPPPAAGADHPPAGVVGDRRRACRPTGRHARACPSDRIRHRG